MDRAIHRGKRDNLSVAHWDDERDKERVENLRKTSLAITHKEIIDKYEETGDDIYWYMLINLIRKYADDLIRNKKSQKA
jgi:hypothetical protein